MLETQIQSVIRLMMVGTPALKSWEDVTEVDVAQQVAFAVSGDDGVFYINRTSGVITLQTLPIFLKREIFNIKVRVSYSNMFINAQMREVIASNPSMIRPQK